MFKNFLVFWQWIVAFFNIKKSHNVAVSIAVSFLNYSLGEKQVSTVINEKISFMCNVCKYLKKVNIAIYSSISIIFLHAKNYLFRNISERFITAVWNKVILRSLHVKISMDLMQYSNWTPPLRCKLYHIDIHPPTLLLQTALFKH